MEKLRGKRVAVVGIDGAGKSTFCEKLSEKIADSREGVHAGIYRVAFPTHTIIGSVIRAQFKTPTLTPYAMPWLFLADGIQAEREIRGRLEVGFTVLMDRHPLYCAYAYQVGEHYSKADILNLCEASRIPKADMVIFLDVPIEIAMQRIGGRVDNLYERSSFQEMLDRKLRYKEIISQGPHLILEASLPVETLVDQAIEELSK